MKKIILASSSPRRAELLRSIHVPFETHRSLVSEDEYKKLSQNPEELAVTLATKKVQAASASYEDAIIIGADTMVIFGNSILGKPRDRDDARIMLRKLSGNNNVVMTGYAVIDTKSHKIISGIEKATVYFRTISEEEITHYIETKEPMDKAGAYGMQERAGIFIERIDGEYGTVVGLPVSRLSVVLKEFEIDVYSFWNT